VSNAIVHRALWEYLSEIETLEDKAEAELLRREIYELSVYPLLSTLPPFSFRFVFCCEPQCLSLPVSTLGR
jgi:hypothetical protein